MLLSWQIVVSINLFSLLSVVFFLIMFIYRWKEIVCILCPSFKELRVHSFPHGCQSICCKTRLIDNWRILGPTGLKLSKVVVHTKARTPHQGHPVQGHGDFKHWKLVRLITWQRLLSWLVDNFFRSKVKVTLHIQLVWMWLDTWTYSLQTNNYWYVGHQVDCHSDSPFTQNIVITFNALIWVITWIYK